MCGLCGSCARPPSPGPQLPVVYRDRGALLCGLPWYKCCEEEPLDGACIGDPGALEVADRFRFDPPERQGERGWACEKVLPGVTGDHGWCVEDGVGGPWTTPPGVRGRGGVRDGLMSEFYTHIHTHMHAPPCATDLDAFSRESSLDNVLSHELLPGVRRVQLMQRCG